MRKIILLILILMFGVYNIIHSQNLNRCGIEEYEEFLLLNNPELQSRVQEIQNSVKSYIQSNEFQIFKTSNPVIRIPVVVHIIGDDAISLIDANKVHEQINILNQDYRKISGTNGDGAGVDTEIEFCLVTQDESGFPSLGFYTYPGTYPEWNFRLESTDPASDAVLKSIAHWTPAEYLNLYVTDLVFGDLGYANYPGYIDYTPERDGVVIDPNYFGLSGDERNGNGRTATHEVGHWLGLKHTFSQDTDDCVDHDEVNDTPICFGGNFANITTECTPHPNQCTSENTAIGLTDLRQIENYMDWSDDLCMSMFTQGQADKMLAWLNTVRLYTLFASCGYIDPDHCFNNEIDADETGLNCGGADCPPCETEEFIECNICAGLWPNYEINGLGPFSSYYRVRVCPGNPIEITNGCQFWECFSTFFSIQACDYLGNPTGIEFSMHFQSSDDILYLNNLVAQVGGHLYEGQYYRIKFANSFESLGIPWAERVRLIYIVPNDVYYENFDNLIDDVFPDQTFALNKIETIGQNLTVFSGETKTFTAQNKIILNPGFTAELGSNFIAEIETIPCPTFKTDGSESNNINEEIISQDTIKSNPQFISIQPNPNTGIFSVQTNITTLKDIMVQNLFGKTVYQSNSNTSSNFEIDLRQYATGVYLVKIRFEDGVIQTKKIIYQ